MQSTITTAETETEAAVKAKPEQLGKLCGAQYVNSNCHYVNVKCTERQTS